MCEIEARIDAECLAPFLATQRSIGHDRPGSLGALLLCQVRWEALALILVGHRHSMPCFNGSSRNARLLRPASLEAVRATTGAGQPDPMGLR